MRNAIILPTVHRLIFFFFFAFLRLVLFSCISNEPLFVSYVADFILSVHKERKPSNANCECYNKCVHREVHLSTKNIDVFQFRGFSATVVHIAHNSSAIEMNLSAYGARSKKF